MAMGLAATTEGPFWASAIDIGGTDVGAACGVLNAGGNAKGFLAPLITPFVASFAGWQWGPVFSLPYCLWRNSNVVACRPNR
jgi:hypothetical protein